MEEKQITRKQIIIIHNLFKILLLLQSSRANNLKDIIKSDGINFQTFYTDIFHIFSLGKEKAKILFDQLDINKNGFISWEEFLETMRNLMIRTKKGKAMIFRRIADSDQNGFLSYKEVYYLAFISIKNNFFYSEFDIEENSFVSNLVTFLTHHIFKVCKVDVSQEIPVEVINRIIIEDKEDANLFLFFCSADFN